MSDLPNDLDVLKAALSPLAGLATLSDWQPVDLLGAPGASALVTFADGGRVRVSLNANTLFLDAPAGSGDLDADGLVALLEAHTASPFKFRLEPPGPVPVFALEGRFPREEPFDLAVLVWQLWATTHWRAYLFEPLWENA